MHGKETEKSYTLKSRILFDWKFTFYVILDVTN